MRFRLKRDELYAVLVILPSILLLAVFVYGSIAQTFRVSLTDWGQTAALSLQPEINYVGLSNYADLFGGFLNIRFRQDLTNMVMFTVLFVGLSLATGLVLASLVDNLIWGETVLRTVFLYPMSLSFVVTGTVWRWLLQPRGGINLLPTLVGLRAGQFLWLSSRDQQLTFDWALLPHYAVVALLALAAVMAGAAVLRRRRRQAAAWGAAAAMAAAVVATGLSRRWQLLPYSEAHGFSTALWGVVLAAVWQMSGYTMALYLAGLRTVPDELREAAYVDGASRLQIYRHVELPMLMPITVSAIVILGHIALKIFDLIFAMAGPDHAPTSVPAITMFLKTFRGNQLAVGAAIGTILLVIVSLLIVPYVVTQYRGDGGGRA